MSGFPLSDTGTRDGGAMRGNILDLDADDVAATELAVDSETEQGALEGSQISLIASRDPPRAPLGRVSATITQSYSLCGGIYGGQQREYGTVDARDIEVIDHIALRQGACPNCVTAALR